MNVTGVDLLLTYRCTSRCAHCIYRAGPHHKDVMSDRQFDDIVQALAGQPLKWIMFFGGEPLLLGGKLLHWSRMAAAHFPDADICVFTNGYWAQTMERTHEILKNLRDAGVTTLYLSYDAFHAEYTPPANIQRILDVLQPDTLRKVVLDSEYVLGVSAPNEYNRRTQALLDKLRIPPFVHHAKNELHIAGRMADNLPGQWPITQFADSRCPTPYWLGPSLAEATTVEIDCHGNVTLCPGICIGNMNNTPLRDILANYNPDQHPVVEALERNGIAGLLQLAVSHDVYDEGIRASSPCHACYELRRTLQPIYPQALAPAHIYLPQT